MCGAGVLNHFRTCMVFSSPLVEALPSGPFSFLPRYCSRSFLVVPCGQRFLELVVESTLSHEVVT